MQMILYIKSLQEEVETSKKTRPIPLPRMNNVNKRTSVNIVGRMEHAPILARIAMASVMVTNMKPHVVTRWVEAHITANACVGWKNKSKVYKYG